MKRLLAASSAVAVCGYLILGFYEVEPEEEAVAFIFGRLVESQIGPGIHWHLPPPIGRQVVMPTRSSLTQRLGYGDPDSQPWDASDQEDIWITGGVSAVEARLSIQYSIARLDRFLLSHHDPESYMRLVALRQITRFMAGSHVDDVLTAKRQLLRSELLQALQLELDEAETGIQIQDVAIDRLAPPRTGDVADAFQRVQSARSDRERTVEAARSRASQILFNARAEADAILSKGRSYHYSRVRSAQGEAERFIAVAREHALAPAVTERRLYLDTVAGALRRARIYVVPDEGRDTASITLLE